MIYKQLYDNIKKDADRFKDYEYNAEDPDNRDKIIRKNMRIAAEIALKMCSKYNIVDQDEANDILSAGLLGLSVAYEKYDPNRVVNDKPAKFSSVAWMWANAYCVQEVKHIIDRRNNYSDITDCYPDTYFDDGDYYYKFYQNISDIDLDIFELRYGLKGEKPKSIKEISKLTGWRVSIIKQCIKRATDQIKENCLKYNLVYLFEE